MLLIEVMKSWILLAAALCASAASAETLSQNERDRAMSALHASRKSLLDSVAGLSVKQLAYKPGPDRWSVAEVVEHLAETETMLFEMVSKKLMASPPAPEKKDLAKGNDQSVVDMFTSRANRAEAPPPVRPTGRFKTIEDALSAFKERRAHTILYAEKTPDDLRAHFAEGFGKPVDAYQILLGIAGHTNRHVAQIQEVKAAEGFPKK